LDAPDLVLSDTVMPGISGYELVQRIRSNWPHVPLVLMSGYAEDPRVQEEIARGVAFLAKPFSPQSLLELLARTFGSSGA
jgi:CheY-like chemotaxis protein